MRLQIPKQKAKQDDERRIGRFRVSHALLRSWKSLWPVMSKVVIVRAESHFTGWVEYTAFSKLFDIFPEELEPPCYEFILTKIKGKPLKVEAKKSEYQW